MRRLEDTPVTPTAPARPFWSLSLRAAARLAGRPPLTAGRSSARRNAGNHHRLRGPTGSRLPPIKRIVDSNATPTSTATVTRSGRNGSR